MADFQLKGAKEMAHNAGKFAAETRERIGGALTMVAELIMTKAKDKYVPINYGALRDSGHVDPPVVEGADVSVAMSFGGPSAPYALAIHEHPSEHSPPSWAGVDVKFSPPGRGPKYLERPFNEAVPTMMTKIAKYLSRSKPGSGGEGTSA